MSRITPLKPEEVIRRLKKLGFDGPISGGRHVRMINQRTRKVIPLPVHGGRDIGPGLIREIIREVGITPDEWGELS